MLNIRTVILSVVLVLLLMVAVPLVTARTEIVADPSSHPASVLNNQEQSASQNRAPIPSYRSPLDECYDVPLREAASCRNTSQPPVPSYRSPLDVCYDVPLREVASCRIASQVPVPAYRSPLDVCYDVPLSAAAACRLAEQADAP
jgi:hypothetical protein